MIKFIRDEAGKKAYVRRQVTEDSEWVGTQGEYELYVDHETTGRDRRVEWLTDNLT